MGMALGSMIALLGIIVAAALMVMIFMYIIIPCLKGIGFLIEHVARFIGGMFRDTFRMIGAVPAMAAFALLSVLNVIIGRWSAAAHFGSHVSNEVKTMGGCVYRLVIGHPLRLIGLGAALEGIENRVPAVVAEAPGRDRPNRRVGQFEGYTIVGSLPGGGSGGRLYVAQPSEDKRRRIIRARGRCPDRVVIKAFAVGDGSSLPQIVRESRALEGAKQIGLIIEHELTDDRFFYVMPFVAGDNLGTVVRQMHAQSGDNGLSSTCLHDTLVFMADVLSTLDQYHKGGLWHKDIKPENIVVNANGAHVVDLGLVTSLRSAMTLTTHGTEYFRDPEMVRMALRGVKVHEVDGAKFDIYGAGAVLYFALENTFPSHGGLSTISKRCPEAVKWIVRRAMTDYNRRYNSAELMLRDLEAVLNSSDAWAMKPADLPSMRAGVDAVAGGRGREADRPLDPNEALHGSTPGASEFIHAAVGAAAGVGAAVAGGGGAGSWPSGRRPAVPRFRLANWWTGGVAPSGSGPAGVHDLKRDLRAAKREMQSAVQEAAQRFRSCYQEWTGEDLGEEPADLNNAPTTPAVHFGAVGPRMSAAQQLANAQCRASRRRRKAHSRRSARLARDYAMGRHKPLRHPSERVNVGMIIAAGAVLLIVGAAAIHNVRGGRGLPVVRISPGGGSGGNASAVVIGPNASIAPSNDITELEGQVLASNTVPKDEALVDQMIGVVAGLPSHFLIINDHPDLRSKEIRDKVASIGNALERIGLQPIGDSDLATTLDARVRTEVSRVPSFDLAGGDYGQAEEVVGSILGRDDQLKDLGVVVWLAKGSDSKRPVITWVLTPDCAQSNVDDQILGYLSR